MTENDKHRFAAAMLAMYKAFGKEPDKDISRLHFHSLQHLSIEGAEWCISKAIEEEERFPTVHAVRRWQSTIPAREVPKLAYRPDPRYEKQGEYAMKLINGYTSGKMTREQFIEGFLVLDKQFPGMGWREEAAQMVQHWRSYEEEAGREDIAGRSAGNSTVGGTGPLSGSIGAALQHLQTESLANSEERESWK